VLGEYSPIYRVTPWSINSWNGAAAGGGPSLLSLLLLLEQAPSTNAKQTAKTPWDTRESFFTLTTAEVVVILGISIL
jgi:hypothetical protein